LLEVLDRQGEHGKIAVLRN